LFLSAAAVPSTPQRWRGLVLASVLCGLCLGAAAQGADWQLNTQLQMGLDAWHIEHQPKGGPLAATVFMPDTGTRWQYREVSPWYVVQAQLRRGYQGEWVLKSRANQSAGAKVDQLYYDHAVSPKLGFRAGVVDYRATWCRVFDLDNPWVREADPFCSNQTIQLATASAPGLQTYTNLHWGRYQVQALAGLYKPKLFNYEPREFSDFVLAPNDRVIHNTKLGLTLNAMDLQTSTEWRLSWIYTDQLGRLSTTAQRPFPATIEHKAHLLFGGLSWQVSPRTRARITHMRSDLKATINVQTPPGVEPLVFRPRVFKASTVLELNYQHTARDIFSVSVSQYPFQERGVYEWKHQAVSVGWRRDWSRHWYSAVQLSHAKNHVPYSIYPDFVPAGRHSAHAVGVRVGFKL
jgi:hypothetical protein